MPWSCCFGERWSMHTRIQPWRCWKGPIIETRLHACGWWKTKSDKVVGYAEHPHSELVADRPCLPLHWLAWMTHSWLPKDMIPLCHPKSPRRGVPSLFTLNSFQSSIHENSVLFVCAMLSSWLETETWVWASHCSLCLPLCSCLKLKGEASILWQQQSESQPLSQHQCLQDNVTTHKGIIKGTFCPVCVSSPTVVGVWREHPSSQCDAIWLGLLNSIGQQSTIFFHHHTEGVSGLATHPTIRPNTLETLPIQHWRTPSNHQTCFLLLPCPIHSLSSHALLSLGSTQKRVRYEPIYPGFLFSYR